MDQFLKTRDHPYIDLTLEFLGIFYIKVTCGPHCQEGYMYPSTSMGNFMSLI